MTNLEQDWFYIWKLQASNIELSRENKFQSLCNVTLKCWKPGGLEVHPVLQEQCATAVKAARVSPSAPDSTETKTPRSHRQNLPSVTQVKFLHEQSHQAAYFRNTCMAGGKLHNSSCQQALR